MLLGADVELDAVQELLGDALGVVRDGGDGRLSDEMGQAADHSAGAPVQVGGETGQGPRAVVPQPQCALQVDDQLEPRLPLLGGAVGQWVVAQEFEAPGELLPAGADQQRGGVDVDAGVDERRGDTFAQVLDLVGGLGAGAGAGVQQVDVVDQDQLGPQLAQGRADRTVIWAWFIRRSTGTPRNRANSLTSILGVEAGGTETNATGSRSLTPGCLRRSVSSKIRPSSISVVVLPVLGSPETIRPRRAVP